MNAREILRRLAEAREMTLDGTQPSIPPVNAFQLLLRAFGVIEAGGDPMPCHKGAFCLGCCIGRAQMEITGGNCVHTQDLIDARNMAAVFDDEKVNTKETAMAAINRAIKEFFPGMTHAKPATRSKKKGK